MTLLMFRLDQEVALVSLYLCLKEWLILDSTSQIYPAPWNAVKGTYLFCRYYPLATAPFHIWGLLVDHDPQVCKSYFRALYACAIPTVCQHPLPI